MPAPRSRITAIPFSSLPSSSSVFGLACVLEEETQCFLGLNMRRNAAQRSVFLEAQAQGGERFALLTGDPLYFLVHFVPGGADGLSFRNARKEHGRFHFASRLVFLAFLHLVPVEAQLAHVPALFGHRADQLIGAILDLLIDER